ncbi:uncharacterized protein LOC126846226 [Adelges cooleyi]|uniref:uncharacterized protein LOC126846226 n=1 Tax=Adelges cooleyi TaxID=133065 RepID=UPI00217F3DA4|nr:uncharacterized protein LOC126846226 [Adelges cooleyi]
MFGADTITRRLRPGVTVDYQVRFKPVQLPNSVKYPSLDGVKLAFETVKNNRLDVKYVFYVPLKFCTARPEPEVVSGKTITFPINPSLGLYDKHWKRLILKNNGPVDCKFSVLGESDYQRLYYNHPEAKKRLKTPAKAEETETAVVRDIVHNVLDDLFSYFTWKNHTNVLLPAKKTAEVTVAFNHYNAESSMSKSFVIVFHEKDYRLPNQIINVYGQVRSQSIFVEPDVVDMGVCYLEGYCRIGTFALYNKGRVMIPFEIIAPRELNDYVELVPSKGYLKAGHRLDIHLRLNLKYEFLQTKDSDKYLKAKSGFLEFPLRVFSTQNWLKLVCEVRVFAVVSTSFGLKLSPKCLRFGTVNTTETVVRNIRLFNRSLVTMDYGFLKLPERVCVLPSAFGTIFSGEQLHLHIYYSPRTKDMPKDVYDFKDEFDLTCTTIAGMNANEARDKVVDKRPSTGAKIMRSAPTTSSKKVRSVQDLDHGPMSIAIPKADDRIAVELNTADKDLIRSKAVVKCQARVLDLPVELSAQKIVMAKTHLTSFSTCKFELRASNLASAVARGSNSTIPKFLVRFEFVSIDPCLEFKPKNGTLRSKEAVQIVVVFRPKLSDEFQSVYDKHFNSEQSKDDVQNALTDKYSIVNQVVFKSKTNLLKNVRRFETDKTFFAWMPDRTITVPAVCFVQLCEQKPVKHFGFERGSLKLTVVCPMTKPDFVVLSDHIDFGKCTMKVRHNDWLLVHNLRDHPIPLRISMPDPTGPFFCAYALNGEHTIEPDQTVPINVYFTPEHELAVKENIEIASGTMRVTIKLSGTGIGPSCTIVPDDLLFVIRPQNGQSPNKLVVQVTNTGPPARFNVQLEWTKVREYAADDDTMDRLAESLLSGRPPASLDGPEWTPTDDAVFDLANGGRPLRRHLAPNEQWSVTVALSQREDDAGAETARDEGGGSSSSSSAAEHEAASVSSTAAANAVYAAKLNVHVGQAVLKEFYVFSFVDVSR